MQVLEAAVLVGPTIVVSETVPTARLELATNAGGALGVCHIDQKQLCCNFMHALG